MKSIIRIVAVLLCVIFCLGAVACANGENNNDAENGTTATPAGVDDTTVSSGTETQPVDTVRVDENGYLLDDLPDDIKSSLDTDSITFLYWEDVERPEFFVESVTGDIVSDNIYERNIAVEDRLGIKLNYIPTAGNVNNTSNFLQVVNAAFTAGDKTYDILASHSRTGGVIATHGLTTDFLSIEDSYLDLEKPWWPSSMIDTATIGDKMFFVSGDISTNTLHFMYGVYYNADMIVSYGLEDPTDLAIDGKWTIDKMIAMTDNLYNDLNNNGKADYGDFFGLTTLFYHADTFYTGCGMKWIEKSDADVLCVSPDFSSEKAINLSEKLTDWFTSNYCYTENNNANTYLTFSAGNSLFAQNRIYIADSVHPSKLNGASFKYGVVPNPKYDEAQERYYTAVGNPFTLYEIMNGCEKDTAATAVLECLASESYRRTTPAIFEVNMKCKYASDEKTAQAFDIIRENIVFDLGRIFGDNLGKMSEIYSKSCIDGKNWASSAKSISKLISKQLAKLVEGFED